jgi:hypothetical protein
VLILVNPKRVVDGTTFGNLIVVIVYSLIVFGGLLNVDIVNKVDCFGTNGVTMFQGSKIGVTIQLKNKHNPFIVGIHCMTH